MTPTFAFHRRRGALLLLVLGVLTMFVLVGTVMLTLATRARSSSRAFAAATAGTAAGQLDAVGRAAHVEANALVGHAHCGRRGRGGRGGGRRLSINARQIKIDAEGQARGVSLGLE
jgi:hypothetical protein